VVRECPAGAVILSTGRMPQTAAGMALYQGMSLITPQPAHPSFEKSNTRRSRAQTQARTQSLIPRTLHTRKGHHKPTSQD